MVDVSEKPGSSRVAASVALLTIYNMSKAIGRGMCTERIQLEEKCGRKSGLWRRSDVEGQTS